MFRKEGRRKTEKKEQQFKTMRKFEIQKRKKNKKEEGIHFKVLTKK